MHKDLVDLIHEEIDHATNDQGMIMSAIVYQIIEPMIDDYKRKKEFHHKIKQLTKEYMKNGS